MKIAIELNTAQVESLKAIAASLGVNAEELAQAAVADLVSANADDFETIESTTTRMPIQTPMLLTATSAPLPSGDPPHVLTFKPYKRKDFSVVGWPVSSPI